MNIIVFYGLPLMEHYIQLESMTEDDQKVLGEFLLSQKDKEAPVWEANTEYSYIDEDDINHKITFSHAIFLRHRSLKNHNVEHKYDDVRFGIIDHEAIGRGGFSKVYPLIGTLAPTADRKVTFKTKPLEKQRVVKVINMSKTKSERVDAEKVNTDRAGQLHVKPTTYSGDSAYLAMRKANGQSLRTLLENKNLDFQKRFLLTEGLLLAIDEFIHKHNMVHQDLKPENIFVDTSKKPYQFTILDFGCSEPTVDNSDDIHISHIRLGTPKYDPPEKLEGLLDERIKVSKKSDVFAAGRIISEIWGNSNFNSYQYSLQKRSEAKDLEAKLNFPPSVPRGLRLQISMVIKQMTQFDYNDRASLASSTKLISESKQQFHLQINEKDSVIKATARREILKLLDPKSSEYQSNPGKQAALRELLTRLNSDENMNSSYASIYYNWQLASFKDNPKRKNIDIVSYHKNFFSRYLSSEPARTVKKLQELSSLNSISQNSPKLTQLTSLKKELENVDKNDSFIAFLRAVFNQAGSKLGALTEEYIDSMVIDILLEVKNTYPNGVDETNSHYNLIKCIELLDECVDVERQAPSITK